MTNMKNIPEHSMCAPSKPSEYPYGLKLCLNEEVLKRLGIEGVPETGAVMMIKAKAYVCSSSDRKEEGHQFRSIELQITDLELGGEKESKQKMAKELYGE